MNAQTGHKMIVVAALAILMMSSVVLIASFDDESEVDAANSFTLRFNGNGGSGVPSTMSGSSNSSSYTFTIPDTIPKRSGFDFMGWDDDPTEDRRPRYDPGDDVRVRQTDGGSLTLYAIWGHAYTVNYNANGGSSAPSATVEVLGVNEDNPNVDLSTEIPTRSGYTFLGWSESSNGQPTILPDTTYYFLNSTRTETVYAIWAEGTFDGSISHGSTMSISSETQYLTINGKRVLEVTLVATTDNHGESWDFEFKVTKIASYTNSAPDIAYEREIINGSIGMYTQQRVDDTYFPVGTTDYIMDRNMTTHTPSSRMYGDCVYTFMLCDYHASDSRAVYPGTNVLTFTVSFEPLVGYEYTTTVNFDANGGTNAPSTITDVEYRDVMFSGNETLTPNRQPTNGSMTFLGWATSSNGDVVFEPGEDIVVPYGSTNTLYAIWGEATADVTFISNGSVYITVSVPIGQTVPMPDDPELYGYTFKGWFTSEQFTTEFDTSTLVQSDFSLYAKWEGNLEFTTDPVADGTVTPVSGSPGTVLFSATGSQDYTSVLWDFGDGTTSTNTYVTHYYSQPGTYTATLTVYNNYGSDTTEFTIEVPDSTTGGGDSDLMLWIAVGLIAVIAGGLVLRRIL